MGAGTPRPRTRWDGFLARLGSARLAWRELKSRYGWRALIPFTLLLALAALLALLKSIPLLAPFVYPLF